MKKITALLISALTAATLAGCGEKESTPGEKVDSAVENTKEAANKIDVEKAKDDAVAAAKAAEKKAKEAAKAAEKKAKEAAEAAEREAKEAKEAADDAKGKANDLMNSFKN